MDKLRLSIGDGEFSRLYNWRDGFHNDSAAIAFPPDRTLTLFLISVRDYQLSCEGDAAIRLDDSIGNRTMRFYEVRWSEDSQKSGRGSAVVRMINPDFPDDPFVFQLTLGDFSFRHDTPTAADQPAEMSLADEPGVQAMIGQEMAHSWMGQLVGGLTA